MADRKIRIIRCKCNYELAFGASTCPYCFSKTPLRNRYWFWGVAGIACVGATAVFAPAVLGITPALAAG